MHRKFFIIFFLLIFICSMFSIVAFAEVDYSEVNSTVDLLKASTYNVHGVASGDGEYVEERDISSSSSSPIVDFIYDYSLEDDVNYKYPFNEFQRISITWNPVIVSLFSKVFFYFSIYPNTTTISINGTSYPLNYSDSVPGYYAAYVSFIRPIQVQEISITFDAPQNNTGSTFTASPGVISAFGFNVFSKDFSSASVNAYNYVWNTDTDDLYNVDKDYFLIDSTLIPGLNSGSISYQNDFYQEGATGVLLTTIDLCIDLQSVGPDYLNFFKMDYAVLGEIREVSSWVGSDRFDAHDYLTSLPLTNIYSDSSIFEFAFDDAEMHTVDADNYSLFIDLHGIDLKPYRYLNISITFEPVDSDRDFGTYSFFNLNRITGFYSIAYDSSETIILSSISSLLMNSNSIYSALISIQDYFTVNENQSEEVTDKAGSVTNQAESLNDGINHLEHVERPEIDFGNLVANTGLHFGVMPTNLLSVITYNKYILPILLFVFTGALGAYLLFGKR